MPKFDDITKFDYVSNGRLVDDIGLRRFRAVMAKKLTRKRSWGRGWWNNDQYCLLSHLWEDLEKQMALPVEKRDPVDIANFAMFIWNRLHPTMADQYIEEKEKDASV